MRHPILSLAALALFLSLSTGQTASAAPPLETRFEQAMERYDTHHFQDAYARFVALADEGHAESARIAVLMVRWCRVLYGADLHATHAQRQAWSQVAMR